MAMRLRLLLLLPAAALAGGIWAGCTLYGPDLLVTGSDAGGDAAAPEGGNEGGLRADAGDGGVDGDGSSEGGTCVLAHPPPPPTKDDPSDGGDIDILLAVRTFDLGLNDGGPPPLIGYDLDGLCTCPGAADCVATSGGGSNCDQLEGRDNAGGALLQQFYMLSGGSFFSPDSLNAQIAAGLDTLLVRVRNYNGTANDTQVELSLYISDGTTPLSDGGAPPVPVWNGQDAWIVDSRSVFGASGPPILPLQYDSAAYVVGGVLVANPKDFFVPLQLDSSDLMVLELQAGIVTGNLAQAGGGWTITDGVLDGRLLASNLLSAFAYINDPDPPGGDLCQSSPFYSALKGLVCTGLDITSDPSAPHSQTCDALSLGIGFAAQSAQFGPVETVTQTTTCPDAGPDHC